MFELILEEFGVNPNVIELLLHLNKLLLVDNSILFIPLLLFKELKLLSFKLLLLLLFKNKILLFEFILLFDK